MVVFFGFVLFNNCDDFDFNKVDFVLAVSLFDLSFSGIVLPILEGIFLKAFNLYGSAKFFNRIIYEE